MFCQRKNNSELSAVTERTRDGGKCAKIEVVWFLGEPLHERAFEAEVGLESFVSECVSVPKPPTQLRHLPRPAQGRTSVPVMFVDDDNLQLFITLYHINV